jgi:glucokinase
MRLLADIGGTNARFALADADGRPRDERVLRTADYPGPVEAARAYLGSRTVETGVFAGAGLVEGDQARLTNSPWSFSISETAAALGLRRLVVINDFVAQALAVPELGPEDVIKLGGGEPVAERPIAVIGPGTGLGVAGLLPRLGGGFQAMPSEGGHASYAPHDELATAVLARLQRRFGEVSSERVLAGPGLVNVATALAEIAGEELPPLEPRDVVLRAREGSCRFCAETVHRYPATLGAAAGDLALTLLARGGVYVGGGLGGYLGDLFDAARFRAGFVAKGRFRAYLEGIPTWLVIREHTGLLGAAALRLDD